MIARPLLVLLAATALGTPTRAAAQSGTELVAQALSAYRALDYAAAAAFLRRALAVPGKDAVSDTARATAYIYLGAAELLRGRPREADGAFRQALATYPSHRPDTLIFPPNVTNAFEEARRGTAYVQLTAPEDTSITPGDGRYPVTLHASAPHEVTVALLHRDGSTLRLLYTGPVRDSLTVRWNGLAETGEPLTGALAVQVASPGESGRQRVIRLPIDVRQSEPDTLPHPPRPAMVRAAPEPRFDWGRVGALAGGLVTGTAAVVLPALVGHDGGGEPTRYAVGIALGLGGVIGFFSQGSDRSTRLSPSQLMAAWREDVERIRAENARRRGDRDLRIRVGAPTVSEERP
jgi:hypothetical protein